MVSAGGWVRGQIDYPRDRDWFAVTLQAGKTYQIDLEGSDSGAGSLWAVYLHGLYRADGTRIHGTADDHHGEGNNSRLLFTASHDATYYVAVRSYDDETGTYTLRVTDVSSAASYADDFLAWTGTTGTVSVGSSTDGRIDYPRDHDWFAVTLEGGRIYLVDLQSWHPRLDVVIEGVDHTLESQPEFQVTGDGILRDPFLRGVYDATGNLIPGTTDNDGGAGLNSRLEFTAPESGTYYLAAAAYEASEAYASLKGTYRVSVEEVMEEM